MRHLLLCGGYHSPNPQSANNLSTGKNYNISKKPQVNAAIYQPS